MKRKSRIAGKKIIFFDISKKWLQNAAFLGVIYDANTVKRGFTLDSIFENS